VGVLVGASAGIRFVLAQNYPGPWIFHDEVAYSDLARSLGRTGALAIRDVAGRVGFGPVYPALIAPAYALFDHVPTAYEAARAINAVLMSLVAIPTYALARRLVRPALALIAAVLSVALPSMTYTTAIMTENAFYPLFMLVALAMYLAIERPTVSRQLLVFPPIVAAFWTRAQGIGLVPALAGAIVLSALFDARFEREGNRFLPQLGRRLAAYWVTWAVLAGGSVLIVLYEELRGRSPQELLGSYSGVTGFSYQVSPILRWLLFHLGEIDLYVGLLPFAAFLFVTTGLVFAERSRPLRSFAAISLPIFVAFALIVSAYASNPIGHRIEERNFFYVAPLLFIALAIWVDRGLPRRSLAAVAAVLVASVLPGAVPYDSIIDANAVTGTFGLLPLMKLEQTWVTAQTLPELVVLGAIAAGLLLLVLPARFAAALPLVVLGYLALIQWPIYAVTERASVDSAHAGIEVTRGWIDRAAGPNANVAIVYSAIQALPFWYDEVFNASVRKVYNLYGPYDGLPQTQLTPDAKSQLLLDPHGKPVRTGYVLANQSLVPRGEKVAEDRQLGMALYRTAGPLRLEERIDGIYPDTWSGPTVGYQRYGCRGGRLVVTLTSDPSLHPYNQVVTAMIGQRQVARETIPPRHDVGRRMVVPLTGERGLCAVVFNVSPTAVPAQRLGTGDARELGIRFTSFIYHSPLAHRSG
jgi:Dolichyl-phosphate-mannose-protein mannosyltransferase